MSEEQGKEVDHMDEVDRNPKAHEDSTPEEQELLREEYGEADSNGIFGRPAEEVAE